MGCCATREDLDAALAPLHKKLDEIRKQLDDINKKVDVLIERSQGARLTPAPTVVLQAFAAIKPASDDQDAPDEVVDVFYGFTNAQ